MSPCLESLWTLLLASRIFPEVPRCLFTMVGLSCTLTSEDLKGESLQLLRGGHRCEGLVQVGYHGQRGLLCGDSWDLELAALVCRQLDCGKALVVPTYVIQPEESPQVMLQGVHCQGAESSLWECSLGPWGTMWDCGCQCISAVHCSDGNLASLRLSGGSSPCTGTFEIRMQADVILKCGLPKEEASIFCRQLGCGSALQGSTAHLQGRLGSEQLKVVTCQGTETHIFNCRFNLNLLDQCDHSSDTVVVCSGHMEARLVGGDHTCAGLLEVRRGLTWGTVCEADLDLPTAHVICRERHCGSAVSTPKGAHFGQGSGPVWTEAFHCMGNESLLFDCPRGPGHWELCDHSHDAGLRCSGESVYRALRLRDGQSRCDGRVEISLDGVWSRVLDDAWDLRGATVVCRQLQCGKAEEAYEAQAPGYGIVPVGLQHARCLGNESHLDQCNLSMSLLVPVESLQDAGVVCSGRAEAVPQTTRETLNYSATGTCSEPCQLPAPESCQLFRTVSIVLGTILGLLLVGAFLILLQITPARQRGLGDLEVPPGEAIYEVISDVSSPELYEETVGIEDELQVSGWLLDPRGAHPALNEGGDSESFSQGYDDIVLEETAS